MDPRRNPYSPGAGVRPPELAGRDRELEMFEVLRHRAEAGRAAQPMVLTGLTGVGKTVLLNDMLASARRNQWITAKVEADLSEGRTPFRSHMAASLTSSLRQMRGRVGLGERLRTAMATFKSFSVTTGVDGTLTFAVDIDRSAGRGDTGLIIADLTDLAIDLGEAAAEAGVGAALFVDEMQHLSDEDLAAICQACHEAAQQSAPFYVVGAGLPSLPGILAASKSYAERLFRYMRIDSLDPEDAAAALTRPAAEEDVQWDEGAVELVLDASSGYPYFIQQFGQTTWDAANGGRITAADADDGIRAGRLLLDDGFFRARWDRATRAEREYLAAMALDGEDPSSTGEIAQRVGKKATSLSPARANLIAKGLVYAPEHGQIAFTVPGMAGFIERIAQG